MADGSLMFDTTVDTSGFSQGSSKITKEAEKAADNVSAEVNETSQKIQAILDDTTRSMKSKAMSISAIYRAQGLEQSEAMQKAWSHIERGSADANDDILNDTKKTHKKIRSEYNNTSGEAVDSFKSTLSGVKSILGKMAAAVAAAFSIGALINFGKQAVTIASDVQEVQNVVDTAFGEMAYKMEAFADTAIKSFGISRLSAKQTGSTLMSMAKGMGIANDSASDMAVTLTGLSADMASFYNVSQDVASTALKSIFTGETETLKQFGIVTTEANLQAFALSQGITKNVSAMTQAEKVQLRYAYVMQQTSLAQGDFAKTSNSWANQTRILAEQWKEFSSIIGTVLVNVLTPAVKTLNSILSQLIVSARNAAAVLSDIFGFDLSQSFSLAADSGTAADNYADIANSAEDAAKATERQLMGFDEINKLSGDSGGSGTDIGGVGIPSEITSITADTEPAEQNLDKLKGVLKKLSVFFRPVTTGFEKLWETLKPFGNNVGDGLKWFWDNILVPFGQWTVGDFIPAFLDGLSDAIEGISAAWETAEPVLMRLWEEWLEPIAEWTGDKIVKGVKKLGGYIKKVGTSIDENDVENLLELAGAITAIYAAVKVGSAINKFADGLSALKGTIGTAFSKLTLPVGSAGNAAGLSYGTQFVAAFAAFIAGWQIGSVIYDKIGGWLDENILWPIFDRWALAWELAVGRFEIIKKAFSTIGKWFRDRKNDITGAFSDIGDFFSEKFTAAKNGIHTAFENIGDWFADRKNDITGAFSNIGQWFSQKFALVKYGIVSAFTTIKSWAVSRYNDIVGAFSDIGEWFSEKFTSAAENIKSAFSSVTSFFSDVKEEILDLWEDVKSGIADAINWMIDAINTNIVDGINGIGFDLPEIMGGGHVGFDIPHIPRLATGTVVPANFGEFAAILGDNKREPEIVSPYSTMMQAFKDALSEMNSGKTEIIKLVLDGKTVSEVVRRYNTRNTRATNGGTI